MIKLIVQMKVRKLRGAELLACLPGPNTQRSDRVKWRPHLRRGQGGSAAQLRMLEAGFKAETCVTPPLSAAAGRSDPVRR